MGIVECIMDGREWRCIEWCGPHFRQSIVLVTNGATTDAKPISHIESLGHSVTTGAFAGISKNVFELATLNAADLVLVSRNTSGGAYNGQRGEQCYRLKVARTRAERVPNPSRPRSTRTNPLGSGTVKASRSTVLRVA